jgi:hypothetical protein
MQRFLLPQLVELLAKINLFELARNAKSIDGLRKYITSGRWTKMKLDVVAHDEMMAEKEQRNGVKKDSGGGKQKENQTQTEPKVEKVEKEEKEEYSQQILSVVFQQLCTYIEKVSALLDDLTDYGSRKEDKSRSGGAPALGSCFEEGSYLNDPSVPFDHVYLLHDNQVERDKEQEKKDTLSRLLASASLPTTAPTSTATAPIVTPLSSLPTLTVFTPCWYALASDIFLSIVTGQLKEHRDLEHQRTTHRCLRRALVLNEADLLGSDARRPSPQSNQVDYFPTDAEVQPPSTTTTATQVHLGLDVHRTLLQYDNGQYYSAFVLHATCLTPPSRSSVQHYSRVLVLHEHSNIHSSIVNRNFPASSNQNASLLARLTAPHACKSGNGTHYNRYLSGRTKSIVSNNCKPLSTAQDVMQVLCQCACVMFQNNGNGRPAIAATVGSPVKSSSRKTKRIKTNAAAPDNTSIGGVHPTLVLRREAPIVLKMKIRVPDL